MGILIKNIYNIILNSNYCINPADYDFPKNSSEMDIIELNYGLGNFDNFLMSFSTNMNYFTLTGWNSINIIVKVNFRVIIKLFSIAGPRTQ